MAQRPPPAVLGGTLLAAVGGLMRATCYRALGPSFTFELAIRAGHRLVTHGPYARVRHPGYGALLLAVAGTAAWHASAGSWARECGVLRSTVGRAAAGTYVVLTTAILGGLISRMALEDAALRRVFGAEWEVYAERVPYKLVPWIY
ncbi:hypothetical protein HYPSUDRAFT_34996 [Hypholoma sublateritium FD-334 SS-4]|uniref:Protein-S-isoprenylcysteine O-methyltransferase n=1 Tax=Hypholoma sublateritium (strain FD-334 SS-4) TaxID=945553 RepID=A0A0D2LJH2_HYPSF|nr:hypothetical protein HYPSUDRAFT_34996 [Hypholoma sublateritium FD-334 SS-4]